MKRLLTLLLISASLTAGEHAPYFLVDTEPSQVEKHQLAPDFLNIYGWYNSEPLEMDKLRGKVVLLEFWSYACLDCLKTLPHLNRWYATYKDQGLVIIGVHTPEYTFEYDRDNVQEAIKRYGIHFPVALDNTYATWRAYKNHYWPTYYLIDKEGFIKAKFIGEGNYREIENSIRSLLNLSSLEGENKPEAQKVMIREIYLGSQRANGYAPDIKLTPDTVESYNFSEPLQPDKVGLKGLFRVAKESVTSAGNNCQIAMNFQASKVYLVLSGTSSDPITVLLDGKPLPERYYTNDQDREGQIFLDGDRNYSLLDLHGELNRHILTINLPPGISAYAFNFERKVSDR